MDRLIRLPLQFVGAVLVQLLEDGFAVYDLLTGREAKFRQFQAEQRERMSRYLEES